MELLYLLSVGYLIIAYLAARRLAFDQHLFIRLVTYCQLAGCYLSIWDLLLRHHRLHQDSYLLAFTYLLLLVVDCLVDLFIAGGCYLVFLCCRAVDHLAGGHRNLEHNDRAGDHLDINRLVIHRAGGNNDVIRLTVIRFCIDRSTVVRFTISYPAFCHVVLRSRAVHNRFFNNLGIGYPAFSIAILHERAILNRLCNHHAAVALRIFGVMVLRNCFFNNLAVGYPAFYHVILPNRAVHNRFFNHLGIGYPAFYIEVLRVRAHIKRLRNNHPDVLLRIFCVFVLRNCLFNNLAVSYPAFCHIGLRYRTIIPRVCGVCHTPAHPAAACIDQTIDDEGEGM